MNKILITGAGGTLGQELLKYLSADKQILALGSNNLDVTAEQAVFAQVQAFKPEVIFHFAGKTNVDWCQTHVEECNVVNIKGTLNITLAAQKVGAILVFPSTYYVYEGLTKIPVDDRFDRPSLSKIHSVYTRSKILAEEEIVTLKYPQIFVLRLGSLFGGGKNDKKFVGKILSMAKTKKEIAVVTDRFVQPSYTRDTIKTILALVAAQKFGTYNMVGHGNASFYEYARAIFEYANVKKVRLIPIAASEFSEDAPRAQRLEVINGKLADLGLDLMRDWRVALKEYIQEEMIE